MVSKKVVILSAVGVLGGLAFIFGVAGYFTGVKVSCLHTYVELSLIDGQYNKIRLRYACRSPLSIRFLGESSIYSYYLSIIVLSGNHNLFQWRMVSPLIG